MKFSEQAQLIHVLSKQILWCCNDQIPATAKLLIPVGPPLSPWQRDTLKSGGRGKKGLMVYRKVAHKSEAGAMNEPECMAHSNSVKISLYCQVHV
jgi:hypothetical protein